MGAALSQVARMMHAHPMVLGSSAQVQWAPSQVPPWQTASCTSQQTWHNSCPHKGLMALLDKQDHAEHIQGLGRGPLGISASSQALLCSASGLAVRENPEPSAHCQPIACPQPCCPPLSMARHQQAGFSQPRRELDIKKKAGRNAESPHHLFRTAAASRTPALPIDQSSARWH